MKPKVEISLLLSATILYIVSVLCYSYETRSVGLLPVLDYPYRVYALPIAVVASMLLAATAFLYLKRK